MTLTIFPGTTLTQSSGFFGDGTFGQGAFGVGDGISLSAVINPVFPLAMSASYRTITTDLRYGREQRRSKWTYPRRRIEAAWEALSNSESALIWNFYQDRRGDLEPFWFVITYQDIYKNEYIGKGDGAATVFDLPSFNTDSGTLTVYVAGTPTAVTFVSGTGEGGADQIEFATAPSSGAVISADLTGKLRLKVRFDGEPTITLAWNQAYHISAMFKEAR